jgi:hypothetical protein
VRRFVPEVKEALKQFRTRAATLPAGERTAFTPVDTALAELVARADASPEAVDPTP